MIPQQQQAKWWHPINKKLVSKRPVIWFTSRVMHHLDRYTLRITDGKHTAGSVLTGLPIVMLTTTGAKSGKQRTVPLVGFPDGDVYLLIASNWGQARYPSWYYNLRANPEAIIAYQGRRNQYIVHEATGSERELYWNMAVDAYAGYAAYEQHANERSIPIMVCVPKTNQPSVAPTDG